MRVSGATSRPGAAERGGRKARADFQPLAHNEATMAAPAGSVGMLSSVDALLALQDVESVDRLDNERSVTERTITRGEALLDDLTQLRDALLGDALDPQTLRGLSDRLAQRRPGSAPAELEAILDDIELRCAVEIAKHEVALGAPDDARDVEPAATERGDEPAPQDLAPAERAQLAGRVYGQGRP